MTELLSARKLRRDNEVLVDLGDGTHIRARKEDLTQMVFEGRVPMPMLSAVQRMIEMPNATPMERMEALGIEHGRTLIDVLKEHACKVGIEPVIVLDDDGNPDHLPVEFLDVPKLMAIWTATAVVPQVTARRAAEFRSRGSADVADVLPPRESVPPAPEQLDRAAVNGRERRDVEFVGL